MSDQEPPSDEESPETPANETAPASEGDEELEDQPLFIGHPVRWLKGRRGSLSNSLLIVLSIYIGLLGLTFGAGVFAALKGDVRVDGSTVAIIAAGASFVGLVFGLAVARSLYQPHTDILSAKLAAAIAETRAAELRLKIARRHEQEMVSNAEAMDRFGIYADHIYRFLEDVGSAPHLFAPLGDDMARSVCAFPRDLIRAATGISLRFSLWLEGNPEQKRERVPVGEDAKKRVRTFWVACAPDHSPRERKDFEVLVRKSWLQSARDSQESAPDSTSRVFNVDDLSIATIGSGPDLTAFKTHDFRAVAAIPIRFGDRRGYLVGLSRQTLALSRAEQRYIELLGSCVNLASDLAVARGLINV